MAYNNYTKRSGGGKTAGFSKNKKYKKKPSKIYKKAWK